MIPPHDSEREITVLPSLKPASFKFPFMTRGQNDKDLNKEKRKILLTKMVSGTGVMVAFVSGK